VTSLPPVVWIVVVGAVLLLLGLCGATAYGVLRISARSRIARWTCARILILLIAAAVPWLVVWLAPIRVSANIHGIAPLVGWVLVALVVFALLVLLPLAAVLCTVAWWVGHRARGPVNPSA
jgi:uncharacterized paraquat-inducible protein A